MASDIEQVMFGCSEADLEAALAQYNDSIYSADASRGPLGLAFSILSDAQEQIDRGLDNEARQTINRAKWLIHKARGE